MTAHIASPVRGAFVMLRNGCSALALVLCLTLNPLRAEFVISFDANTNIAPGGSGFVNVYISSNSGPQTLSQTSFILSLSPTGPTRLEFQDSPPPASDPTYANSNYVFSGNNSLNQAFGAPLGTRQSFSGTNDRFGGGDLALLPVVVDATAKLLGMIPVTAASGAPPAPGSTFTISLVPTSGSTIIDNTGFADGIGNWQPFTSSTGTITVTATPEPSAMILVGTGVGLSWLIGRRRGRAS